MMTANYRQTFGGILAAILLSPCGALAGIIASNATLVTASSASANVYASSSTTNLFLYWGLVDQTTNTAAWGHTNSLGTVGVGRTSSSLAGLTASTTYYYRFYAATPGWSGAVAFQTLPSGTHTSAAVMVYSTGVIAYPANFRTANGLGTGDVTIAYVQAQDAATSNGVMAKVADDYLPKAGGTLSGPVNFGGNYASNVLALYFGTSGWALKYGGMGDRLYWSDGITLAEVWSAYSDGTGSGLDADLLDGHHFSEIPTISITNGLATRQDATNAALAQGFAYPSITNNLAKTNLFAGSGTSGLVTSAAGDAGKFLRADGTWQTAGGASAQPIYGYINGCWPQYKNASQIIITNGDGYCSNQYFQAVNTQHVSVATWGAAWSWQYLYCSYANSTFPASPVFYASTSSPTYATNLNQMVCSTNVADRYIGAAIQTNTTTLLPFSVTADGLTTFIYFQASGWEAYMASAGILVVTNGNPDGTWMSIASSSSLVPVGTSHVQLGVLDYGGQYGIASADDLSQNRSLAGITILAGASVWNRSATDITSGACTIPLGPSRSLIWWAPDATANYMNIWIQGFRIRR